ncbi:MAG: helix-turn-helix domain-containing protein [Chloroflexota bacterium]
MKNSEITTFDELLDVKYGKRGTPERENWEAEYKIFKIGVLIEEARKKRNMTQSELAAKCGTNKGYISRVENDATDVRLSTLLKIVRHGLGGELKVTLEL